MKIKVKIPLGYTEASKNKIGEDLINKIKERTLAGNDKNGKKFPEYNPLYAAKKGVAIDAANTVSARRRLRE